MDNKEQIPDCMTKVEPSDRPSNLIQRTFDLGGWYELAEELDKEKSELRSRLNDIHNHAEDLTLSLSSILDVLGHRGRSDNMFKDSMQLIRELKVSHEITAKQFVDMKAYADCLEIKLNDLQNITKGHLHYIRGLMHIRAYDEIISHIEKALKYLEEKFPTPISEEDSQL